MWKIGVVLAAILWHAKAGILSDDPGNSLDIIRSTPENWSRGPQSSHSSDCTVPSEQIDRAVAALLSKLPAEYKTRNEGEEEIFTGFFIGPFSLGGMNRLKVLKPYDVYCNYSNGDLNTMLNVEFILDDPLTMTSQWRYCESQKGSIGTTMLLGRFTVVFEVQQRSDGQGIELRPKELHPIWMENILVHLNGMGTLFSDVFSVVAMLFPEFVRTFWVNILPYHGLNTLIVGAAKM